MSMWSYNASKEAVIRKKGESTFCGYYIIPEPRSWTEQPNGNSKIGMTLRLDSIRTAGQVM
jgi:hypothetical protein